MALPRACCQHCRARRCAAPAPASSDLFAWCGGTRSAHAGATRAAAAEARIARAGGHLQAAVRGGGGAVPAAVRGQRHRRAVQSAQPAAAGAQRRCGAAGRGPGQRVQGAVRAGPVPPAGAAAGGMRQGRPLRAEAAAGRAQHHGGAGEGRGGVRRQGAEAERQAGRARRGAARRQRGQRRRREHQPRGGQRGAVAGGRGHGAARPARAAPAAARDGANARGRRGARGGAQGRPGPGGADKAACVRVRRARPAARVPTRCGAQPRCRRKVLPAPRGRHPRGARRRARHATGTPGPD